MRVFDEMSAKFVGTRYNHAQFGKKFLNFFFMKSTVYTLLLILISALTFFNFKYFEKKFVPPGTVFVNDTLYWDKSEVSNLHWFEFVYWNKKYFGENSEQYKNSLPDTTVWRDIEPERTIYHNHPAYRDYPVVGITYEQAIRYCNWRTERVKEVIKSGAYNNKIIPENFYYRLPEKIEWEYAASAVNSEKTQKLMDSKKYTGYHFNNVIVATATSESVKPNPNATITAPVKSYFPNIYGIYNLIGNVAEMTATKGIAKGGSWNDLKTEVTIEKDFVYDGANSWTGFRCVCEVKWNKTDL
jgi:formylglycine-generating enzyme required for sulfatase activity